MVRLIGKTALGAALVAAVAWVGLAWSQTPPSATDSSASSVTMTVHENGKAIQCRLLTSWHCANGARAFQLEVLGTGEKLTMVEDGPGTSFQSKAGKMRSLPMRIFHWGRSHTSPPGAPVPPAQMISAQDVGQPTVLNESDPVLVRISPEPVAPPGCEICSIENTPNATPYNTVKGGMSCTSSKPCAPPTAPPAASPAVPPTANESVVMDKPGPSTTLPPGSTSTPKTSVPSTSDPAVCAPGIGLPPSSAAPAIAAPGQLPQMVNMGTATGAVPEPVRSNPPPLMSPDIAPGMAPSMMPQVSGPGPQLIPIDPRLPSNKGVAAVAPNGIPAPGLSGSAPMTSAPSSAMPNAQPTAMANAMPATMPPAHTGVPAQNLAGASGKSMASSQPRGLVQRLRSALNPGDKKQQPTTKTGQAPEPLTNRVSPDPQKTEVPQLADLARGQFPAPGTTAPGTTAPGSTAPGTTAPGSLPSINRNDMPQGTAKSPGMLPVPAGSGPQVFPGMPAAADNRAGSPSLSPASPGLSSPPSPFPSTGLSGDLARPQGNNPAPASQNLSSLLGPGSNAPPASPSASGPASPSTGKDDPAKRDWRSMWGKPPAGPSTPPGQSVVEPTPSGNGPKFAGMQRDNKSGPPPGLFSTMPPTSVVQNSKQPDPLMSPDRYGSPKVDNKALGDRRVMEAARYRETPPAVDAQPAMTAPVGIQSVVSANNGMDMPLRFVPVPMVTVPNPMRPPGPPRPEVPQPPSPAAWTNAFASVRQAPAPSAVPSATGQPGQPGAAPLANMGPYTPGAYGPQVDPSWLMQQGMQGMPGMQMARSSYGPNPYPNAYGNPAMMAGMAPRPPMSGAAVGSGQWPWDNDAAPPLSAYKSQRPVAHIAYPQTYAGPQAPNPAGNLNAQSMSPMMPPMQPMAPPYAQTAGYMPTPVPAPMYPPPMSPMAPMPRPELAAVAAPPDMAIDPASVQQWLSVLHESPYPAQREWAAMNLAGVDLQACPDVLQALLTAARKDPAATVRAGCVQYLARQNLTSQPVLTTLHTLASDPDPRVRTEAEQSLIRLTGSHSTPSPRTIQPVNARQ